MQSNMCTPHKWLIQTNIFTCTHTLLKGNLPTKSDSASCTVNFLPSVVPKTTISDKLHCYRPDALVVTKQQCQVRKSYTVLILPDSTTELQRKGKSNFHTRLNNADILNTHMMHILQCTAVIELRFCVPLDTRLVILELFLPAKPSASTK